MPTTEVPSRVRVVPRTQDRMAHDVWLPEEIIDLRGEARAAVEKRLVPHAREIGQRALTNRCNAKRPVQPRDIRQPAVHLPDCPPDPSL